MDTNVRHARIFIRTDNSVVVPATQMSWISKAIFISDKIHESHYTPPNSSDKWTLLSGTPATCAAIGIHHICTEKPDLLISGPNFGRNTSSIAALSSGTIGAALEGAGSGVRSVAVSYAFEGAAARNEEYIAAASDLVTRLCEYLYNNWDEGVDLYTVNVPLCEELLRGVPILRTRIHQAQHSCLFQRSKEVPLSEEEVRSYESEGKSTRTATESSGSFEFRPRFEDLSRTIDSEEGRLTDTWAIRQREVSVTPLRANFQHVESSGIQREIKL